MQRTVFRRAIALISVIATVLVLLFSTVYIEEHYHHDCSGSDCPICIVLEQCDYNVRTIGAAVFVACSAIVLFSLTHTAEFDVVGQFVCNSLISQKVRLNN